MKKLLSVFLSVIIVLLNSCDCSAKTNFLPNKYDENTEATYKKGDYEKLLVVGKRSPVIINNECHSEESLKSKLARFGLRWLLTSMSASLVSDAIEKWVGAPLSAFSNLLSPFGFLESKLKSWFGTGELSIKNDKPENKDDKDGSLDNKDDQNGEKSQQKKMGFWADITRKGYQHMKWGLYFSAADSFLGFPIFLCLPLMWKMGSYVN